MSAIFLRPSPARQVNPAHMPRTGGHESLLRTVRLDLADAAALDFACARLGLGRSVLLRSLISDGLQRLEIA